MVFTKEQFDIKYPLEEVATDKRFVESLKRRLGKYSQKELGGLHS